MAISEELSERLHSLTRSNDSADVALGEHLLGIAEDDTLNDNDILADAEQLQERSGVLCEFIRNLNKSGDEDASLRQP